MTISDTTRNGLVASRNGLVASGIDEVALAAYDLGVKCGHDDNERQREDDQFVFSAQIEAFQSKLKVIEDLQKEATPDFVIEAINGILATGKRNFTQNQAIAAIQKACAEENGHKPTRDKVFKEGWLDFEPIFREAGWTVVYDKPAYYEDYEANFTFTSKKSKR